MHEDVPPEVIDALALTPSKGSAYPEPFASRMCGRSRRALGNAFGLRNFGVNLTTLAPGGESALRHAHATQDEFVWIVSGEATLVSNTGRHPLKAGMCAGFRAGNGNAHQLRNESDAPVIYLEVGDRSPDDRVSYPDDDLMAVMTGHGWQFFHKNGQPYD